MGELKKNKEQATKKYVSQQLNFKSVSVDRAKQNTHHQTNVPVTPTHDMSFHLVHNTNTCKMYSFPNFLKQRDTIANIFQL